MDGNKGSRYIFMTPCTPKCLKRLLISFGLAHTQLDQDYERKMHINPITNKILQSIHQVQNFIHHVVAKEI